MKDTGHMTKKIDIRASQDLHVTSVLSFPNANKKVYFNP